MEIQNNLGSYSPDIVGRPHARTFGCMHTTKQIVATMSRSPQAGSTENEIDINNNIIV